MTINSYRLPGEAPAHPDATKESATAGNRGAADKARQSEHHSTVEQAPAEADVSRERGLFLPLLWAELGKSAKPQKFKGKAKRKSRADAINAKRYQGTIAAELAGLILLALVAGVLLMGGA